VSLRDRLRARQLPTSVVVLAGTAGEPDETITQRALTASEWEALVGLHPPATADAARGAAWDVATFRPALLAASVVSPEGEEPLSEQDWAELIATARMTAGEVNALFNGACLLNDRAPDVTVGKDSGPTRS
jgi:hypothetical protein